MGTTSLSVVNTLTATANQTAINGTANNPISAIANNPIIPGTGSITIPSGTTGQRLLNGVGSLRVNTTTGFAEISTDGLTWVDLAVGGGGVATVTGTANRITSTGGANPVIDIAATYIGQASITTLGTITTGIWNAGNVTTPLLTVDNIQIDLNTISSTNAGGDILLLCNTTGVVEISSNATKAGTLRFREPIAGGTNFITFQAPAMAGDTAYQWWPAYPTANGQLSTCTTAGVMTWTTATFPSVAGAAGTILRSDGTNWIASTSTFADTYAASTLLYSNGANTVTGLATAANGILVTSAASVPSILAGPGTTGNMLQSNAAAAPSFSTATYPSTTTINQILYSSAANTVAGLATANTATLVTSSTGVPSLLTAGAGQSAVVNNAGTAFTAVTLPGSNMIVNGDFQVWQRGAGGTAAIAVAASTTAYTADRWQFSTDANEASTATQAAGATSGAFIGQFQRNNAQTGTGIMRVCTSLLRTMCTGAAGNIVTLSFKAKCGANFSPVANNITVTVYSGTGTSDISGINGAFTGSATPISQTQALTTTLTNYTFSSAALGATVTQLAVQFSWTPSGVAGADDSAFFTDVQLEISPNQSAFQRKSFPESLQLCQAFYYKTFPYSTAPAQATTVASGGVSYRVQIAGTTAGYTVSSMYARTLRAVPTVTYYSIASANTTWRNITGGADSAAAATDNSVGFDRLNIRNPQVAGDAVGNNLLIHFSCDADVT